MTTIQKLASSNKVNGLQQSEIKELLIDMVRFIQGVGYNVRHNNYESLDIDLAKDIVVYTTISGGAIKHNEKPVLAFIKMLAEKHFNEDETKFGGNRVISLRGKSSPEYSTWVAYRNCIKRFSNILGLSKPNTPAPRISMDRLNFDEALKVITSKPLIEEVETV